MSVAGLVLGIIGTVLAVVSLTWQVVTFWRQRPRPRLTPVAGFLTPDGLVTNDAGTDTHEALFGTAQEVPPGQFIVGVKVVNPSRTPLHIAGWAVRADPGKTSLVPVEDPIEGNEVPYDIPPGGSAIFLTKLRDAHRFANGVERAEGQAPDIVLTVSCGRKTYATKPLAPSLFSTGAKAADRFDSEPSTNH
ncbi:hypothetical protein A5725_16065 [Mycobacterium kubicae]|uniref:hypothetical protein n=1 Tax=Mycobacterium kubicae TaxID=120959 RepID=UPI000801C2C9|nr:hypothetical protein [Mycobacterium kubicae]OBF20462.1 hypothetical protein A5725_16065 [Mycobacterium kubicae]